MSVRFHFRKTCSLSQGKTCTLENNLWESLPFFGNLLWDSPHVLPSHCFRFGSVLEKWDLDHCSSIGENFIEHSKNVVFSFLISMGKSELGGKATPETSWLDVLFLQPRSSICIGISMWTRENLASELLCPSPCITLLDVVVPVLEIRYPYLSQSHLEYWFIRSFLVETSFQWGSLWMYISSSYPLSVHRPLRAIILNEN